MSAFEDRPPYGAYAAIVGTFAGFLAAAGALGRLVGRDPQCQTPLDFVVLAAASFKAAHTLSHDEVTSFIRQPFVRGQAHGGDEEPLPRTTSCRRASARSGKKRASSKRPSRPRARCRPPAGTASSGVRPGRRS